MKSEFEICNIYPIKNQKWYVFEKYVMILAHLLHQYDRRWFNKEQYIIMDNGLFEGKQVSTSLQNLVDLAFESGLPIKEIVIPDAVNDYKTTQRLFIENLPTIMKYKDDFNFMYVAQANNIEQLKEQIEFIECMCDEYQLNNIVVGISKLTPLARDSYEVRNVLKGCIYPIHFLGIKIDFVEAYRMGDIIRSVDTSQLCHNVKNGKTVYHARDIINDIPIDLENDDLDDDKIKNELVRSWYRY